MDSKRQGEIALVLIKALVEHKGVTPKRYKDLVGKISTSIGISVEELKSFGELVMHEIVEECFAEAK